MLIARPTQHGAGLTLYGDYWDLENLHRTIHDLAAGSPLKGDLQDYLLGLAYDVRHAFQRDREEESFGRDEYDRVIYRGVKILWPVILFQTALLRWSAAYQSTGKEQQANLYRLEHCAESALNEYDASIARECVGWLDSFCGVPDDYLVTYVTEVCYRYVFTGAAGKTRFKRLPAALHSLRPFSKEYEEYKGNIAVVAKEKGCEPHELRLRREWPAFKW